MHFPFLVHTPVQPMLYKYYIIFYFMYWMEIERQLKQRNNGDA